MVADNEAAIAGQNLDIATSEVLLGTDPSDWSVLEVSIKSLAQVVVLDGEDAVVL